MMTNRTILFLETYLSHVLFLYASYEGESISNQHNLFPVEIHLFFFDVIAL